MAWRPSSRFQTPWKTQDVKSPHSGPDGRGPQPMHRFGRLGQRHLLGVKPIYENAGRSFAKCDVLHGASPLDSPAIAACTNCRFSRQRRRAAMNNMRAT